MLETVLLKPCQDIEAVNKLTELVEMCAFDVSVRTACSPTDSFLYSSDEVMCKVEFSQSIPYFADIADGDILRIQDQDGELDIVGKVKCQDWNCFVLW